MTMLNAPLFEPYAISVLQAKPRPGGGWADFRCRAHDDRTASASINLLDGWVKCHGCSWEGWSDQYASECGLPEPPDKRGDKHDKSRGPSLISTVTAVTSWVYRDLDGKPYLKVNRRDFVDRKTYSQAAYTADGWQYKLPEDFERILYRLPEVRDTPGIVLIVEGEKSADAAWALGFAATTAPGGANKANLVPDWSILQGRDVAIIADNDKPGQQHARQVAGILIGTAATIRQVKLPNLPEKGDLVDWIEAGGTVDQLREIVEQTPAFGATTGQEHGDPKPSTSRAYIERSFICAAWDHEPTAQVLRTFKSGQWKDPVARAAAAAICGVLDDPEADLEPLAVALEMRRLGTFSHWATLDAFYAQRISTLSQARASTYRAFREACDWDDARALTEEMTEGLDSGKFRAWVNKAHTKLADLMARTATQQLKSLKSNVIEWIERQLNDDGTAERETFPLAHLSDVTGEFGGGDVIAAVGAPKTGKSTWVLDLVINAAMAGKKSLVGDLEMRSEQIVKRTIAKILKRPIQAVTHADMVRLMESGKLDCLDNIYYTRRCRALEEYRAEVSGILAKHRDIRIWVTDYAECIQRFGNGANRVDESEAIAKMVKDTAVAFNVAAILMIQPNAEYTKNGSTGPRPSHAKNSTKWEQDAQAFVFLHSPARFFPDMPKEYIELHVLACRDAPPGVIPLRWSPAIFGYERWSGPVPGGGGRSLEAQTQIDQFATPLPDDMEEIDLFEELNL